LNREDAKDTKEEVTPCPSKGGRKKLIIFYWEREQLLLLWEAEVESVGSLF
jgi:hypothetical protein